MRLREWRFWPVLISKEWLELLASRAWWLLLLAIGPLVGNSFIQAVRLYAEASGIGGGTAALAQELTPLDGILVPTWGAYDLAVTLLFPFVVIRLIAGEKESGALKLSAQFPGGQGLFLTAKIIALMLGWSIAWLPGLMILIVWKSYGGHLFGPETLNLLLGHWLRMFLSLGLAMAAAAITESAASAAIVTLGFTLGTWVLDFIAAGRGGWLAWLAAYTPTAVLRNFEQGLLKLNAGLVMIILALAGIFISGIWLKPGYRQQNRLLQSAIVIVMAALTAFAIAPLRWSRDLSENHRNSFPRADEQALRQIQSPLHISISLAAEDPRLMDYERGILNKLQRLLPHLQVTYATQSRTGLFEGADEHYGEIWYEYRGEKAMNRSTTVPIVLEQLYQLTGITPPAPVDEPVFPGYPLAVHPRTAGLIFYGLWPLVVALLWLVYFYRRR